MTETDICNLALSKIGGAGDQESGSGFIDSIDASDPVSNRCKVLLPICRQIVITDLAISKCPFRETLKFADLGTQVDSDSLPEIGDWKYAFNLPGNCLAMVKQFDETLTLDSQGNIKEYRFDIILNKTNNGQLFLTNDLTNDDGNSAYIEYCIEQPNTGIYSMPFINCIATLLASELCPTCGKDIKMRQQMLLEYKQVSKPAAQTFNQSQFNNIAKDVENYLGGRNA